MTWMLTATGAKIDLNFIADLNAISILDIAAALSKINRFTGHTNRLYSVAEHSLHVCHVMERDLAVRHPKALLAGLMHDAHEAYVGDISTPLKHVLGEPWEALERRVEYAVRARFDVVAPSHTYLPQIKHADLIMLATERAALMPPGGPAWPCLDGIPQAIGIDLTHPGTMTPDDWRDVFLERFAELRSGISLSRQPVTPIDQPDDQA
jgi:hypothetical protein